jgi:hypothetical protein
MPLHEALRYVIGAYLVFAILLAAYAAIMMAKSRRLRHDLAAAREALQRRER